VLSRLPVDPVTAHTTLLTVALTPVAALAQERPWEWGWSMHPGWWLGGAGGAVMMLMMLALWGVVITGIVLGIRWLARQGREERPDRALDILRDRYARGEINKEEFEARRRDLSTTRG
jgi:putative membrane protein